MEGFSEAFYITMMGALGGLIAVIFKNIRMSRCSSIDCFCIKCIRDVESQEEMEMELENVNNGNNSQN